MLSQSMMEYASCYSGDKKGKTNHKNNDADTQQMVGFLQVGYDNDSEGLYRFMEKAYHDKFIAVPLMLDVTYAMSAPMNDKEEMSEYFLRFIRSEAMKSAKARERVSMWMEDFSAMVFHRKGPIRLFDHAYEAQLQELQDIKQMFPDQIYPFYSIDPRRDHEFKDGIIGEIKRYVGKDKPFVGLKLYTSLGYSPTDPALYGGGQHESVYGWCESESVPITVHCSYTGFSHMCSCCNIKGDVYYPAAGKVVPAELLYEEGLIPFDKSIKKCCLFDVAEERLLLLNHPKLWRKVLEKYPKLRINLAHCGGKEQLVKYAKGDSTGFWAEDIIDMVCTYPNVYADLSCFDTSKDNDQSLTMVHDEVYCKLPPRAQKKLLYGSDFYMIFLYDQALDHYHRNFVDAFGSDFGTISEENPIGFLNINKGWIN